MPANDLPNEKSGQNRTFASISTFVIIAIILCIGVLTLCSYQLRVDQTAVVYTMGKLTHTEKKPGFHGKLPWPIQRVVKLPNGILYVRSGLIPCYTADERMVSLRCFILWQIREHANFHVRLENIEEGKAMLSRLLRSNLPTIAATVKLEDFFAPASAQSKNRKATSAFNHIEDRLRSKLQNELDQGQYGIQILLCGVEQMGFNPQLTRDILARMAAERQLVAETIRQEGLLQAGKIRANAKTESGRIKAQAYEQAKKIRAEGDLAVAQTYAEFEKNKEFALFLSQLDTLIKLMSKQTTLVIDGDREPFNLLQKKQPSPKTEVSPKKEQ
ncbi:MAG: hypothetical protein D6820_03010 [Lentisphaerae bacterium]|nr:MAG: hypothetical protein D6820_03010 [Lentisphaerota bacterium]